MRINRNVSSADARIGDKVDFEVLDDIQVGGMTVIARGANALATVTEAQPKRRMGRAGKLGVNVDYVRAITGDKVPLRGVKELKGGGKTGAMTEAIVATSIVFFPAAPLFLFVKGKDITIPKGHEVTVYVNGDSRIDLTKSLPQSAPPVTTVSATAADKPLTNKDVLTLKAAGLSEQLILAKVKSSPGNYQLDTAELVELNKAGLSDAIIAAMMAAQKP
jgi:hypothetical protein